MWFLESGKQRYLPRVETIHRKSKQSPRRGFDVIHYADWDRVAASGVGGRRLDNGGHRDELR